MIVLGCFFFRFKSKDGFKLCLALLNTEPLNARGAVVNNEGSKREKYIRIKIIKMLKDKKHQNIIQKIISKKIIFHAELKMVIISKFE